MFICQVCQRKFQTQKGLSLHSRTHVGKVYCCGACDFQTQEIRKLRVHQSKEHAGRDCFDCEYCCTEFSKKSDLNHHMWTQHGLPLGEQVLRSADESALNDTLQTWRIIPSDESELDILSFLSRKKTDVKNFVGNGIYPQKVQMSAFAKLVKPEDESNRQTIAVPFHSLFHEVGIEGLSDEQYSEMCGKIVESLGGFCANGSGWIMEQLLYVDLKLAKFNPIRGSSFIETPKELKKNQWLLNIENTNMECFKYCYIAMKFGNEIPPERKTDPNAYTDFFTHIKGEYTSPMPIRQIAWFEKDNQVNVNVFYYKNKTAYPIRRSRTEFHDNLDLLLIDNGERHHYCLITNLFGFVRKVSGRQWYGGAVCRNCLHVCTSSSVLTQHQQTCKRYTEAVVLLPTAENNTLKFKNVDAKVFVPVVIYFDFESLTIPIPTCSADPSISSTRQIEHQVPCGFSIAVVEHGKNEPLLVKVERTENSPQVFVEQMREIALDLNARKRAHMRFEGDPPHMWHVGDECYLCEQIFEELDTVVLDHCHYSGRFLGFTHQDCNINRKTLRFTPAVAHNLSRYDMHFLFLELGRFKEDKINVIPQTDETYISLIWSVFVGSYINRMTGRTVKCYEELRFIDSCRFLYSSLDTLSSNLPDSKFKLLDHYFSAKGQSSENIALLHKKGVYPYNHFTSFEKFNDSCLPPFDSWKNTLCGGNITISDKEYQHALNVFERFDCKNLGDYHDLYVVTDVLILADIFENFRNILYDVYNLDCAHFFTSSNMAQAAYLKISKVELELITEREHLDMVESMVRGGVSGVYSERIFDANNKYLENFNENQESTYGLFIDANNLYGGVMWKYPLPIGSFELDTTTTIDEVLSTPIDSETGFICEVDLEYPQELHDIHSDYPLAPYRGQVDYEMLSDYQKNLLESLEIKQPKTSKLIQTFLPRKNYVVHYEVLKFYRNQGLRITSVLRILKFKQSRWMSSYIELNTKERQRATSQEAKDSFKLMNNAAFGKTCESKRTRVNVRIARTEQEAQFYIAKHNFKNFKIFKNNLAAITLSCLKIKMNTPLIVGAVILDLSKLVMQKFHYEIMKTNFPESRLLYSDTDSFVYKIKTNDLYEDIGELKDYFDFSNYPPDHPLFSNTNKSVVLKMKDELNGAVMKSFIGLKSKMYSVETLCSQKKSAKGVTKHTQRELNHTEYRKTLENNTIRRDETTTMRSIKHEMFVLRCNRKTLTPFDDKRYICSDGIRTLPYGHKDIEIAPISPTDDEDQSSSDSLRSSVIVPPKRRTNRITEQTSILENLWGKTASAPDPGLNQPMESDSDISGVLHTQDFESDSNEDVSSTHCPFIDNEASVADDEYLSMTESGTDSTDSDDQRATNKVHKRKIVLYSDSSSVDSDSCTSHSPRRIVIDDTSDTQSQVNDDMLTTSLLTSCGGVNITDQFIGETVELTDELSYPSSSFVASDVDLFSWSSDFSQPKLSEEDDNDVNQFNWSSDFSQSKTPEEDDNDVNRFNWSSDFSQPKTLEETNDEIPCAQNSNDTETNSHNEEQKVDQDDGFPRLSIKSNENTQQGLFGNNSTDISASDILISSPIVYASDTSTDVSEKKLRVKPNNLKH